jgi:rRNA maturation RNase YbeY
MEERMVQQYHIPFLAIPFSVWRLGPVSVDVFEELSDGPVLLDEYISLQYNGTGIKILPTREFNDDEYSDEEGDWKCVGDIIISLDTLTENATYFAENKNEELKRLLVHGLLHLNGMDHGEEHIEKGVLPQCEMLQIQENILQKLKDEKIIL